MNAGILAAVLTAGNLAGLPTGTVSLLSRLTAHALNNLEHLMGTVSLLSRIGAAGRPTRR